MFSSKIISHFQHTSSNSGKTLAEILLRYAERTNYNFDGQNYSTDVNDETIIIPMMIMMIKASMIKFFTSNNQLSTSIM